MGRSRCDLERGQTWGLKERRGLGVELLGGRLPNISEEWQGSQCGCSRTVKGRWRCCRGGWHGNCRRERKICAVEKEGHGYSCNKGFWSHDLEGVSQFTQSQVLVLDICAGWGVTGSGTLPIVLGELIWPQGVTLD